MILIYKAAAKCRQYFKNQSLSSINRYPAETKEVGEGEASELYIFKAYLVLVAVVHKILWLPIEIASSLVDGVIQL